ncbi:carbohydrate binding family 9 domain-containing protein [Lysobacter brunescens]|uniref:DUF5916 domain-containing protein n=1 Tax=Lysobacter brunescens TaxID=262323 RepID=A0A6B7LHR9_9GAMM|nr:hypothetical protein [Lysobacter brunescens]
MTPGIKLIAQNRMTRANVRFSRKSGMRLQLLLMAQFFVSPMIASADENTIRSMRLPADEKVVLDGTMAQSVWQQAPVFEGFVERSPRFQATPEHGTKVRVLFDEHALYVGIEAMDPEPGLIRAPLVRHDTVYRTQDFVALFMDPTGQRKAAQFFRMNASGSTGDGLYTNDDNQDFSPDFVFEGAARRSEQGYSAVFRVPFSSLRYSKSGKGPWRIMIVRNVPRDRFHTITSVTVPLEATSFIDAMQPLQDIEPPAATALELRPNLTYRQTGERDADSSRTADREWNVGLDFKWQASPEWVIDGTLNPDFSQVQLDVPQLSGNTQFALYVPETRAFFLESADLLRTPTEAIYTRTVTYPRWGLRSTARTAHWSGTAFTLRDDGGGQVLIPGAYSTEQVDQPASSASLVRLQHHGAGFSVGVLASNRQYADGIGSNTVAGADLVWQASRFLRLTGQWLMADTTALPGDDGLLARGEARRGSSMHLAAQWKTENADTNLTYSDISSGFRNDIGFLQQSGVRRLSGTQRWIRRNLGPVNELVVSLSAEKAVARDHHELISESVVPGISIESLWNSNLSLEYRNWTRFRTAPGTPLLDETYWHATFSISPSDRFSMLSISADVGDLADTLSDEVLPGHRLTVDAAVRPLPRLEVEAKLSSAALKSDGGRVYGETASQLLAIWHFNATQTLRLIAQRTLYERFLASGVKTDSDHVDLATLTYALRRSAGTAFYMGASWQSEKDASVMPEDRRIRTELFLKMQVAFD